MQFGSFTFSTLSSCVSSWRVCVKAITAQLHVRYCSSGSPCVHCSKMGCTLGGSLSQTHRLLPGSCRLWKPLLTHFLVQCFVAQLQAVSLHLPTCLGLADTFWPDCSGAAEQSCYGQKGLIKSRARQCEKRSDYSCCTAQRRPTTTEPLLWAKHRKELLLIRIMTCAQLRVLLSVDAGCTSCVQRNNLSYSMTINSCQERPRGVTVGNRGAVSFLLR